MPCRSAFVRLKTKYIVLVIIACFIIRIFGLFTHLFEKNYHTEFEYPYNGDIRNSVRQLREYQRPEINPINLYTYHYITNCPQKCTNNGEAMPLRLVYIIKSDPENFNRRLVIRNTWGYEHRFSDVEIRTVFMLGVRRDKQLQEKIGREYEQFSDIVQVNFIDSYYNNTIKTMLGIKWAVQLCSSSKFYMFADDDYYISTKNVLRFVRNPVNYPYYLEESNVRTKNSLRKKLRQPIDDYELPDDVKLYAGYVFFSPPHRHYTSKWYVPLEEYPFHLWPPYVTAGAYILSREALLEMYYTSFYTKHFRFDDVYLGLVAKKADIEPFHSNQFYVYKKRYDPDDYRFVVASHGYGSSSELLQVWSEQKSFGNA